jgi:hypothetical protein
MNETLELAAWRGKHYLSLADILSAIGRPVWNLKWSLELQEVAPMPGAQALEAIDKTKQLSTPELLHLVTPAIQIIDGKIFGYDELNKKRIIIGAIDSTSWEIETDIEDIFEKLRTTFS